MFTRHIGCHQTDAAAAATAATTTAAAAENEGEDNDLRMSHTA